MNLTGRGPRRDKRGFNPDELVGTSAGNSGQSNCTDKWSRAIHILDRFHIMKEK